MVHSEKQKGVLLMLLSSLFFSAMQIAVAYSGSRIPVMEQVFCRNLISLAVAFVLIRRNRLSLFGGKALQPALFGRSFFGFLAVVSLFYASSHARQADVSILSKLSPFFVTLLAWLLLKEKIAKVQLPALLMAFAGVVIVAGPTFQSNLLPLLMAFASSVTSGIAYTLLRYAAGKTDSMTVIMHFSTFSAVASIPFLPGNFVVPNPKELAALVLIGLFGSLGQIALTYAYRLAPASEVSIYNYSGILFSMALGALFLREKLAPTSLIGGGLVIAASLLVYWDSRRREAGQAQG